LLDVDRPLLLVDAPFFLYRAFHALPHNIQGKDGMPVNALLGSVNAILSAADEHGARAVIACFGPDAAPYRVELFDGYHAHRPPMPRELASQWEQAPPLYEALGWQVAGRDDLEADDLLASYAAAEAQTGGQALIFAGDRDLFQCAGDRVRVLLAARGGPRLIDAAEVERRYGSPRRWCPTSSRCAGIRQTASRARVGSGSGRQRTFCADTARLRRRWTPRRRRPCSTRLRSNCSHSRRSLRCAAFRSLCPRTARSIASPEPPPPPTSG